MARVKVLMKWHDGHEAFLAHDAQTGEPLTDYSKLCYGDTADARAGINDDPAESAKTFTDATITKHPDTGKDMRKDSSPKKTAQLVAWVTVPDA